jgi:DNA-binding GntR family transcriptional regulator
VSKVATSRGSRVEEVRLGLLTDLTSGALPVGAKLVNEIELATRFTVSRLTVREAVSALVTAGYLERRHGSGTYVVGLPGPRHALDATLSYTRMIAQAGMKPGLQLLDVQTRAATRQETHDLDLKPNSASIVDPECVLPRRGRFAEDVGVPAYDLRRERPTIVGFE